MRRYQFQKLITGGPHYLWDLVLYSWTWQQGITANKERHAHQNGYIEKDKKARELFLENLSLPHKQVAVQDWLYSNFCKYLPYNIFNITWNCWILRVFWSVPPTSKNVRNFASHGCSLWIFDDHGEIFLIR